MSERAYSQRMRLAEIRRRALDENEREDREALRERASAAAYPDYGPNEEPRIVSPQEQHAYTGQERP